VLPPVHFPGPLAEPAKPDPDEEAVDEGAAIETAVEVNVEADPADVADQQRIVPVVGEEWWL
jgi:hypothetical protein